MPDLDNKLVQCPLTAFFNTNLFIFRNDYTVKCGSNIFFFFFLSFFFFSSNGSGLEGGSEDLEAWFPVVFG